MVAAEGWVMSQFEDIATNSVDALRGVTGFETRRNQLDQLAQRKLGGELVVCVVGITSSGKSTFLNAMMGEALLPEQAKATTNLMVRCRRGPQRALEVRFRDGHAEIYEDARLNAGLLHALCSEDGNPSNSLGIEFLELTTPRAAVPEGLVLCDTPGLDAYGHEQHGELTLRKYLPLADIALYVTSIRKNIGRPDLALVKAILENDQRVLFALTHADLEVDSYEKGHLHKSREDKLKNHLKGLRQAADEARLNDSMFGLALVSSRLAKDARGDRNSEAWRRSGFEELVAQLERLTTELRSVVEERRLRRLVAVLEAAARDLESIQGTSGSALAGRGAAEKDLKALRNASTAASLEVRQAGFAWQPQLAIKPAQRRVKEQIDSASKSTLYSCVAELANEWQSTLPNLGRALDKHRKEVVSLLEAVGIAPSRDDLRAPSKLSDAFPALTQYTSTYSEEKRVRGWFEGLAFWPKSEMFTRTVYDTDRLVSDIQRYVETVCRMGLEHLHWWQGWMQDSLLRPADRRVLELTDVVRELENARRQAAQEREQQAAALSRVRALGSDARALLESTRVTAVSLLPTGLPASTQEAPPVTGAHRALIPLLATFRELDFRRTFLSFLARLGLQPSKPAAVLFVGHRTSSIGALSSLLHDRAFAREAQALDSDQWVLMGELAQSGRLPLLSSAFVVPSKGELVPGLRVVVAPDDEHLRVSHGEWNSVLSEFDAIGVCIDAPRIDSGLSTLARAPYFPALANHDRVFFASGDGRFFDEKLHLLMTEVVRRVPGRNTATAPWFVFEDYDARYTEFISMCEDVLVHRGTGEELARRWVDSQLSTTPPFDQPRVRLAMDAIMTEESR